MKTRIQQIKQRLEARLDKTGAHTVSMKVVNQDIADLLAVVEVYRDALRNIRTGVGMGESELCSLIYKFAEQALKETGAAE